MHVLKAIAVSLAVTFLYVTAAYAANAQVIVEIPIAKKGSPVAFSDKNTLLFIKDGKVATYSIAKHNETVKSDEAADIASLRTKYGTAITLPSAPDAAPCTNSDYFYPSTICDGYKNIVPNTATKTFTILTPPRFGSPHKSKGYAAANLMIAGMDGKTIDSQTLEKADFITAPCDNCTQHLYAFKAGNHFFVSQLIIGEKATTHQGLYRQEGTGWNKVLQFSEQTRAITLSPDNCSIAWMPTAKTINIASLCN